MAENKPITQEDLDNIIKERLERQEKKIREEFKGWMSPDEVKGLRDKFQNDLTDLKDSYSKELEKYSGYDEKFKEQEAEINSLKVSALKVKIANDKRLPMEAVDFLQGDSEESISESADRLSRLTGSNGFSGLTRNTETEKEGSLKERELKEFARKLGSIN